MKAQKLNTLAIGSRVWLSPSIAIIKREEDPPKGGSWEVVGGDLISSLETVKDGEIITGITLSSLCRSVIESEF